MKRHRSHGNQAWRDSLAFIEISLVHVANGPEVPGRNILESLGFRGSGTKGQGLFDRAPRRTLLDLLPPLHIRSSPQDKHFSVSSMKDLKYRRLDLPYFPVTLSLLGEAKRRANLPALRRT